MSVDKDWYDTVAHYKLFDRIYTPYELDMLCKDSTKIGEHLVQYIVLGWYDG